ncbi:MAG: hypothetical protein IAE91_04540 [Ignavibacteriaceae bacterium]|nr:hypothetical protein [Ignavibacteriaceae bacterium]
MKKSIFGITLLIALFLSSAVFTQNEKKSLIYKLAQNERLIFTESTAMIGVVRGDYILGISAYNNSGEYGYYFVAGMQKFGPYTTLNSAGFIYTLDIWYAAVTKGEKYYLIINGNELGPFDYEPLIEFSADAKNYIIYGYDNGKFKYCVNGNPFVYLENATDVKLAQDGKTLVFITYEEEDESFITIAGKKYGPFQYVSFVDMNEDASKFLIIYSINDEQVYFKTQDAEYGPFSSIPGYNYSKDTDDFVHIVSTDELHTIYLNGKEIKKTTYYPEFWLNNNGNFLIAGNEGEKFTVEMDGKNFGSYDVTPIVFLPQKSDRFFYVIDNNNGKAELYEKGKLVLSCDSFSNYVSGNNDGSHAMISYVKDGQNFVWVNGEIFGPIDEVDYYTYYNTGKKEFPVITYKNGGKNWVYFNGQNFILYDQYFFDLNPRVFEDGTLMYSGIGEDGEYYIFENGKPLLASAVTYEMIKRGNSWAAFYLDSKTYDYKVIINGVEKPANTFGVSLSPDGKKYSYLSYENDQIFLNQSE